MELQKYWDQVLSITLDFGPKLIAAVAIAVVAYFIAKLLAWVVRTAVESSGFGGNDLPVALGRAAFWVTMLVALPAALGALGMDGLLKPMQDMASKFLEFLPNLVGAGLIFGIGFVIAKVAREAITSVLRAVQFDTLAERFGLLPASGGAQSTSAGQSHRDRSLASSMTDISAMQSPTSGLSGAVGMLAFTLLIIPVSIAALDALGIASISTPAKQMLQGFLEAIPNIFAAGIVLTLAFFIARFAADALTRLLPATGVDKVGDKMGLSQEVIGTTSISKITGMVAFVAIMVFGVIEAAKLLNFDVLSGLLQQILELSGRILLGSAVIVAGIVAADFVAGIVQRSKDAARWAPFLRIAIIVLAAAMGLRQMGLANEIINMGFALMIGALAVGTAIAIGWGGKDTAGRLLEKWTKDL